MSNSSRLDGDIRVQDLAGPTFAGIDLQTARLIVWGVHYSNISKVLAYLRARRLEVSKEELYRYAMTYRALFRVDVARDVQASCWHCGDVLPPMEEELCECYNRAVPKVYIEPTLLAIEQEKLSFPTTWHLRLQSVYICSNDDCRRLNDVPLGVVASDLRKVQLRYEQQLAQYNAAVASGNLQVVAPREPTWRPKTKCHACYQQELKTGRRSSAPPPRVNIKQREQSTLASLILSIPPTAES